jgi:hypothetical protein
MKEKTRIVFNLGGGLGGKRWRKRERRESEGCMRLIYVVTFVLNFQKDEAKRDQMFFDIYI